MEPFFSIIDVSKVRSLGKNFGIFSGESPQSFGGEHHTAKGRDFTLVTFGYDEGISSCDQRISLDGIDSNANDHSWLTQWGLLLKHHDFIQYKSIFMIY